jgi:hypothetical protein
VAGKTGAVQSARLDAIAGRYSVTMQGEARALVTIDSVPYIAMRRTPPDWAGFTHWAFYHPEKLEYRDEIHCGGTSDLTFAILDFCTFLDKTTP